jgi:predicted nucleotidyltransferase
MDEYDSDKQAVMREGEITAANSYLKSVLSIAEKTGAVVSVLIFGSFAKGGFSERSDVDLLVVVSDDCRQETIGQLESVLERQAAGFGFGRTSKSVVDKFLSALMSQTGIFESGFVTRRSDFLRSDFTKIFSTNKILTSLIAPKDIVIAGMLSRARTVFGEDLLVVRTPVAIGSGQLLRSLVMNSLLAVGALLISPLTDKSTDLSLEAVKWSLFSTYYLAYGDSPGIDRIAERFISSGILPGVMRRMLSLRESRASDNRFLVMAPIAVTIITGSIRKLVASAKSN